MDTSDSIAYVIRLYLFPLVCIPGCVTAALSCTIFFRMRRSSLDVLLFGLSLFDVLVLTCSLFMYPPMAECIRQENEFSQNSNNTDPSKTWVCQYFWKATLVLYPVSNIAQVGSVWMCVAVAVDRFLAVSLPMRRITFCTPANAAVAVSAITMFSVLYRIPAAFEVTLKEDGRLTQTDLGQNEIRQACQARTVLTNQKPRSERREEAERRMTIMSVVVAALFIITSFPVALINILENYFRFSSEVFVAAANLLVCCNSANNMIIYIVFNRKFRLFIIEFLTPWMNKRRRRCSTLISELEKSKSSVNYERTKLCPNKNVSSDSLTSFTPLSRLNSFRTLHSHKNGNDDSMLERSASARHPAVSQLATTSLQHSQSTELRPQQPQPKLSA
ncbi:frpr-8 [Pristionchus pacificus]|uniref:Frpr-8 n=1 Tax=Pristionchus pacificus TaxID=54126 RepID=A0A2A6CQ84_PRIPA|nr:frpr-8 [Pristionchus pacificus]|eukprot:PDM80217.1 frpr-8 [Pristionchus pacificus]